MSQIQAIERGVEPIVMDPYAIGWYLESADEEIYGPVSRRTVRRFLEDKTITPNTLVRHCTQPESRPVADQPAIMDQFALELTGPGLGDRLADAWPRKKREQQALAEDALPCAWHKRPAVLVCVRCHAPYCNRCRAKPFRKQFYLCKRCQVGLWNRRFGALFLDNILLFVVPFYGVVIALIALGARDSSTTTATIYIVQAISIGLIFFRDALFRGAGPGKRSAGLRVVQSRDGTTPLSYSQAIVRWLSQCIPIFNLFDATAAYSDPLLRRYGDRWAGTRVIDTERRLAKDREKIAQRLIKKGVQPPPGFVMASPKPVHPDWELGTMTPKEVPAPSAFGMTMEELARLA
jgi:uncharacterized RDD family membrane protein YckC